MAAFFFESTRNAHAQHTALYDFVWPTATAMWNLRWQVNGYLGVVPNASEGQLTARFTEGADIVGCNLRRGCVDHTWDQQKEGFARVLLINAIANYEGWIEGILEEFGRNTKQLQLGFQSDGTKGIHWALNELLTVKSALMVKCVHSELSKGRYYGYSKIDALMKCYRHFKELRNCVMHRGNIAEQRMNDAYLAFAAVATPSNLGVSEVPKHFPVVIGDPVRLSLRGVVGFSHIILKLMATIDAELSQTPFAETLLLKRWQNTHNPRLTVPGDPVRRRSRLRRMAQSAGLLPMSDFDHFGIWLKSKGLIMH